MENSIRKTTTVGSITVDDVYVSDFQKDGTKTAQLRQVVTTKSYYPSKQISNDLQDNPFDMDDFGFEEQEFTNEENRVCWIDVPTIINSKDDVLAKLPAGSTLYKMMSNHPILTSNQSYAIDENIATMETFANRQVIRFAEGHADAGKLVLDANGKPQYRAVFFAKTVKTDIDKRTSDPEDFYATEEITAELTGTASVIAGQEI